VLLSLLYRLVRCLFGLLAVLVRFLAAPAHAIIACDFLVVETVLLQRLYVLVFIEHGTRRLHVAGVRAAQQARLTPAQTT
jgi:putative transposase